MMITCRDSTLSSSILLLKHKLLFSSFKFSSSLPSQLVESGYMLISYEKRGTCYYAKLKKLNLRYSLDAIYGMEKKR